MTTSPRSFQRVKIPRPSLDFVDEEGGQHGWVWGVPLPYRAITAPWSGAAMPAAPQDVGEDEGHFEHQLGYYASLQSLLTYSFGWTRPDKGLLWWYTNGQPTDDERFALIAATWERDGNLIGYLAWLSTTRGSEMSRATLHRWAKHPDESPLRLEPEWDERLQRARQADPWNGGSDPLHLGTGSHVSAPSNRGDQTSSRVVGISTETRTATLVSDSILGWYADLIAADDHLPKLVGQRNWHVDVFVKPIGFLGTYRRSRDTGLWFSGLHRHHIVGN